MTEHCCHCAAVVISPQGVNVQPQGINVQPIVSPACSHLEIQVSAAFAEVKQQPVRHIPPHRHPALHRAEVQYTKVDIGLFLQLIYVAPTGESVTPTGYAVGPNLVRLISVLTSGRGGACLLGLHQPLRNQ